MCVLQCIAVCCSLLQCIAVSCHISSLTYQHVCVAVCCSVLQSVAVCCSVMSYQSIDVSTCVCCSLLQCIAVCGSALQCHVMSVHCSVTSYQLVSTCVYIHVLEGVLDKHSSARRRYGVATMSRPLKIIGLFCRISSLL